MRKQYHHRRVGPDSHIWDVHRLIRAAKGLKPEMVALTEIAEIDENWWDVSREAPMTPRALAEHLALVDAADLSYPVIRSADGRLMDGMHRLVRALREGQSQIRAVRFPVTPPPDHINVDLDDLPYPDEEI